MDELNELEAAMVEDEMNEVEVGSGAVEYGQVNKQPAAKSKVMNEEDELKALEMMMAL